MCRNIIDLAVRNARSHNLTILRVRFLPHHHHLASMLPIKHQYLLSSIRWSLRPDIPSDNTSLFTGIKPYTGSLFIRGWVFRSSKNSAFFLFIVSFEILSGPCVLDDDLETSDVVRYSGVEDPVRAQSFLKVNVHIRNKVVKIKHHSRRSSSEAGGS